MSQAFYTSISLPAVASTVFVKVGFQPAYIQLINLTKVQTPAAGQGWRAIWQEQMTDVAPAIRTGFNAALLDQTTYTATGGIALLNPLGAEQGQYGAVVSNFTNAANGVITVDNTAPLAIAAGSRIRVAAVADNQTGSGSLNGDYDVMAVTPTTITVVQSTVGKAVYISGGFVTVLQNSLPTSPNPPFDIYSNVPTFFNDAIQGFSFGTSTFPGATYSAVTPDLILVAAYDTMQP